MHREDSIPSEQPDAETGPSPDARLVQQLRQGDPEASHQFVRDYYPGIYRYLLYLTGRREAAEDLAQETFLQAWRRLETFDNRRPLRPWLHRIAHREFLQAFRSQRSEVSLEAIPEVAAPHRSDQTKAMELRAVLAVLPADLREVLVLHYLEGHSYQEIAQIVSAPVTVVKHRLTAARAGLQRALGEGDLLYLNEPSVPMRPWAWLPLDQMYTLETRLSIRGAGHREQPRLEARTEESMERREFLRQVAVSAAGLMLTEAEKEIVDSRLTQKVTCAFKGTALADLCEKLKTDTGIRVTAGPSVADEKVTLFCEKMPVRDVMRQLSRPFGYIWLRSGAPDLYRYELVQDLRSQLLEEELRNRDRDAALLALEQEMDRFRPYLGLSADEAEARAKAATPAEKKLLEALSGVGWGPIHMYFRLSPQEQAALRAGRELPFSEGPKAGEQPLPPELARGVLQSQRQYRLFQSEGRFRLTLDPTDPRGLELTAVPEARAEITLALEQTELGQFAFHGSSGFFTTTPGPHYGTDPGPYAVGMSPAALKPDNDATNAKLSHDPSLQRRISVRPEPDGSRFPSPRGQERSDARAPGESPAEPRVTTADVLEAIHRAAGLPIVADYYTRLYRPETVTVQDQSIFEALNGVGDALRLRWRREGEWLQFRSSSYYDDRLKEVPNRLLHRWAVAQRQHGALRLDDIVEIARLSDAQLDAKEMAQGAKELFGLAEWGLAGSGNLRPHLRFLAGFTPTQRQEALSAAGLPFMKMPLAQQQQFLAFALNPQAPPLRSPDELAGATLRVEYTQPGWFQWGDPGGVDPNRWAIAVEPGAEAQRVLRPIVRERTREAALHALQQVDPAVREALLRAMRRSDPRIEMSPPEDAAQLFPTKLTLAVVYIPSMTTARSLHIIDPSNDVFKGAG